MKTKPANHKSFRIKADEIFMKKYRGMPCEICGTMNRTVGHHNVPKSRSKALRYDPRNITVLCPTHHTMGNSVCAHSKNVFAVEQYLTWFKGNKSQYEYCKANQLTVRKYSYKQAWENLKEGREAWA
jgi:hypothetical protein